ncbi:diguanylate cyclase [Roseateles sp. NT4]|uniref:GGDEF domain-containing protein n=1 Tax=Roseateles sp. NT4 TaxID=3453715 RepID=UPI003EE9FC2C
MSASPPPSASAAEPDDTEVQRIAFAQCVATLRRTLLTTPLGWGLVVWVCWGQVSQPALLAWLGLALAGWVTGHVLLLRILRQGTDVKRHHLLLLAVAVIDGACWGAMAPLLMGANAILNASLAAILCGVSAVNAPVYITRIPVYFAQCGGLWLAVLTALLRVPTPALIDMAALGLALLLGLLCFYLHGIGARVVEGIRLQLANAALAAQLGEALAAMAEQAATDALTGMPNRRSLDQTLAAQLSMAEREGRPFAVLMLDLDHFKTVNDTHGHAVGDAVLRAFAQRVQAQLRRSDVCSRYGGEEFAVVLAGTSAALALDTAERLRLAVAGAPLVPGVAVTVSIGVASWRKGDDAAGLLARADAALYAAKRAGRDRVSAG